MPIKEIANIGLTLADALLLLGVVWNVIQARRADDTEVTKRHLSDALLLLLVASVGVLTSALFYFFL